jgi:hypothetical protein
MLELQSAVTRISPTIIRLGGYQLEHDHGVVYITKEGKYGRETVGAWPLVFDVPGTVALSAALEAKAS